MVSQCTKFKVSACSRYEDMNGDAKWRNWGSLGQLGVTQGHPQCAIRQSAYDFLFNFNRNYASILYRFRDIASYLSKVVDFNPPRLQLVPPQGVTPVEFRGDLWHHKTRVSALSCGFVCVILCLTLAVLVEHRLVTDRHRAIAYTALAQRGKNHISYQG